MKPFDNWKLNETYVHPLSHGYITDYYMMPNRPKHSGTDLCGKVGDSVMSPFAGTVVGVYPSGAPGGMTVEIMKDGVENARVSLSHLDRVIVAKGQNVSIRQIVGVLAAVPPEKPRPHIHMELRVTVDAEEALKIPKKW